jgi:hypothetical protein
MDRTPSKQPVVAGGRFPKERSVPRYPLIALVEVEEPVSRVRVNGWTSTISDKGCHVPAASVLAAGTIVRLQIEWKGQTFQTWARVASVRAEGGIGLAFFDTDPEQRDTLKKWIEEFEAARASQST